ncbi:hypothetical protein [Lactiplantibacillus carotarum]|uniref:hypothetical protein n=1 Tax=Lactiplantibacillus carotarum TaxID=2993456 RepID=UPI00298EDBCE|nr:hypothetical protein [Lactiplantibacillus carotarum]
MIEPKIALQLWQPVAYTSFYRDQAWRLNPKSILKTKYPDFYDYQYTDAQTTFIQAVGKMLTEQV